MAVGIFAYYFYFRLRSSWDELVAKADFQISWQAVTAVLCFVTAVLTSGALWSEVVSAVKHTAEPVIRKREAVRVHTGAWLLKYVPGQVSGAVYKIAWGKQNGVSAATATLSFVYENAFLTIASILPSSVLLLADGRLPGETNLVLAVLGIAATLLLFSRAVLRRFLWVIGGRSSSSRTSVRTISLRESVRLSAMYILPRIFNGIGFVALASSVFRVDIADFAPLVAAYALAGIIGIYAVFVPSGLGVREAMVGVFAAGVLGYDKALLLGLVTRFYATVADVVLAVSYALLTLKRS